MLVFIAKFVKGLDTVLQAPDVAKASIACSNEFGTHGVRRNGEVQSTKAARHGHTIQASLYHRIEVGCCATGIAHAVAFVVRAFEVDALCIVGNCGASQLARDVEHTVVVVHRVVKIEWRIVKRIFIAEVAFFQLHDVFHKWVIQLKLQFGMICIIVCH